MVGAMHGQPQCRRAAVFFWPGRLARRSMLNAPPNAGEHHSLALSTSGDVYAWGSNAEGQLGDGTTTSSTAPQLVGGPSSGHRQTSLQQPATYVACGARHSLAINALGQCLAWGWSLHGQCGTGKAVPSVPTPTPVSALGPLKCVGVAGGLGHTVVHTDQGDVYAWGLNADGQLGDGGDAAALQVRRLPWAWQAWLGASSCWLHKLGGVGPLPDGVAAALHDPTRFLALRAPCSPSWWKGPWRARASPGWPPALGTRCCSAPAAVPTRAGGAPLVSWAPVHLPAVACQWRWRWRAR